MYDSIPQELITKGLWCCWRKTDKGKIPYDCLKSTMAKSNDRTTFYSFDVASKYVQYYDGLGIGIFNGFSAIDIDSCIVDGVISDMAQEIIDYCQSYTEISPSGTGIRIIFKANKKIDFDKSAYYINNRKIKLEIYIEGVTNKFVTITGNTILHCDVNTVDIEYILNKYMKKNAIVINRTPTGVATTDIDKFISRDKKLNELWNNIAPGFGANESELDLALCMKLAFYLQRDPIAIRDAFEHSPYYRSKDDKHLKKWETVYSDNTIQKAVDSCVDVYNPNYTSRHYDLNDTGNAHRFVDKFGDDIKYNVDNKMWMIWNGINWQFDIFGNVKNLAETLIHEMKDEAFSITDADSQKEMLKNVNRLFNKSGKESMLIEAQHLEMIPVNNDTFDKNDYLFNCLSGVVNLRNGVIMEHNKMMLLNKISAVSVNKDKPVKFLNFLNDMFEGNQELIHYLHKAFGYSLTGDCREQCMFILVGDGNDGKSLLLQIIQEVIGDYSATSNPDLLLDKKTQSANLSEVARLKGIRYCVVNELKMGDRLNESGVKDITSGNNKIVARFLYGNEFEFLPKMKIWLATNYEPRIIGTDKGIWRRIVEIPCRRSLRDDEVDKDLIYKLREEKDQIFNWLIEGCLLWQQEGLKLPECLLKEKERYKTDQDIIQQWVNEYCELHPMYIEKATTLFESFKNYCYRNNEYPMSQTLFGRNFSKKFHKRTSNGAIVYCGIRLKNDDTANI